jgi:hypothetical protein
VIPVLVTKVVAEPTQTPERPPVKRFSGIPVQAGLYFFKEPHHGAVKTTMFFWEGSFLNLKNFLEKSLISHSIIIAGLNGNALAALG